MKLNSFRKGFSLIEVMVALLVLALGVLAVVKLQGVLIQSASDSNQRAVAVSLAQQKIDDLRSFSDAEGFLDIGENTGGAIGASPTEFVIPRGPYRYTLRWEVEDPSLDSKMVTVFVAWEDETGNEQEINLATIIDFYIPALTSLPGQPSPGGIPPRASYTPELAPDVIDISVDTGEGRFRQTSKPLPDVVRTGQNENTIVSFEVMTYQERDGSSDFFTNRQEEFVTVDCNCRLSATPGLAMTPAHVVWDGNKRFDVKGQWVTKQTAVEVNNSNAAKDLCSVCCRDHHDNDASPVKYVPGTSSGNHTHYKADGSVAQAGDIYRESCRMKRVDGILRVFQDWYLRDITILDRLQLSDGQQLQLDYQKYVEDLILAEVLDETSPAKPSARTPVQMNEGGGRQLQSRGVYIDRVYDLEGDHNPQSYTDYVNNELNTDRLEKVPFAEVNLTQLSVWTSDQPSAVSITNEPVATIADPDNDYYGTYSRGWATALEQTTGVDINTTMRTNNDGFTQITTTSAPEIGDTVTVAAGPPGEELSITGTYSIDFPLGRTNTPTIHLTGSGDCALGTGNSFLCSVNAPWSGSIQIKVKVETGGPTVRCTGESVAFVRVGLNSDEEHEFAPFECTN